LLDQFGLDMPGMNRWSGFNGGETR
jgi:hypothetical protein